MTAANVGGQGARQDSAQLPTADLQTVERLAGPLLGAVLLARGLTRDSVGGVLMVLAGGGLLYRGLGGLKQARDTAGAPAEASEVERSITIGMSSAELYRLWREPATLPRVMDHVGQLSAAGDSRTHWVVEGPLGRTMEWDTQVVEERPEEFLKWKSLPGASVPNTGEVRFRPGPDDWGTVVTLRVRFDPPGGALGEAVVRRLGIVPRLVAGRALRRFKSLAETGEIPTLERNPSARGTGDTV